jgi:2-phosphoglycerate kinase
MARAAIWLISGAPGAGTRTLSDALCRGFQLAVHIRVDDIRDWVRSGFASPVAWTAEMTRQFVLARRGAAKIATQPRGRFVW